MVNLEPSSVDWVHPSVRDTVIEYLMDHDAYRQRFLATARASGAVIALSTAGGALGTRQRPLLRSTADWDALDETIRRIGSSTDIREQHILLQGVGEALRASKGDEVVSNLTRNLTIGLLSALRISWDSMTTAVTIEALALYYDFSVKVGYPIASPNLSPTWRDTIAKLESALNDEISHRGLDNVSRWLRMVKLLRDNEPRFLRIEMTEAEIEDRIQNIFSWIRDFFDGLTLLVEGEIEVYEEDEETIEIPVQPDSNESEEIYLLKDATDVIIESIDLAAKFAKMGDELIEQMQKQAEVREARESEYDNWNWDQRDRVNDDSLSTARAQGSGDFDIVEFFSDL